MYECLIEISRFGTGSRGSSVVVSAHIAPRETRETRQLSAPQGRDFQGRSQGRQGFLPGTPVGLAYAAEAESCRSGTIQAAIGCTLRSLPSSTPHCRPHEWLRWQTSAEEAGGEGPIREMERHPTNESPNPGREAGEETSCVSPGFGWSYCDHITLMLRAGSNE